MMDRIFDAVDGLALDEFVGLLVGLAIVEFVLVAFALVILFRPAAKALK